MKRLFDICISLVFIVILSPLMVTIYLLVLFTSPGGGFFRQVRVGQYGTSFSILKFRTMTVKASSEEGSFDAGDSSRITPVGRFLRKFKLDELPQFINVLKGDMAIVGPRPEVKAWVNEYSDRWEKVLKVKPGITDPASIQYRDEEVVLAKYKDPVYAYKHIILPKKLSLYEDYVEHQSFLGDLKLIFKTFIKIVAG